MGEKIKKLSNGVLLGAKFEIELNHPNISGQDEQVHLQSDKFRFEIGKSEYIQYALSVLVAEKNLKLLKRIS